MRRRFHPALPAVTVALLAITVAGARPGQSTAESAADDGRGLDGAAAVATDAPGISPDSATDDLYAPLERVLSRYVDAEGLVDYRGLRDEGRDDLSAFMEAIARVDPAALPDDDARIAFWINAYNATVLLEVVERYPIDSVRDVGSLWGLVGGFFKREIRIAGRDLHLDDIEHGILRAEYPDPRIHWALVCGAFGCPRLLRRPYRAAYLDRILDERTDEFLAAPRGLQIDGDGKTLWLSRYFDWYAEDFEAESGTVLDYVIANAPAEKAGWIRDHRERLSVRFMDYDWTLNDQAKGPREPPHPF